MKRIFQIIGLISLTAFSFFITEKTVLVVKEKDEIMMQINKEESKFKRNSVDAIIDKNTIIPGISKRTVNINKSYKAMRQNGFYNEKLFVFDYKRPKISLYDNKDKYIIKGNPSKRMVSFIFKVNNNTNIEDIFPILNNYSIKSSFFIDYDWFIKNEDLIQNMSNLNHLVEPLFDDYSNPNYDLMNTIFKRMNKKSNGYCYVDNIDKDYSECILKSNYLILPKQVDSTKPLAYVKENLEPGALLTFNINSFLKKELSSIIIYIKSKGYIITNLDENVLE